MSKIVNVTRVNDSQVNGEALKNFNFCMSDIIERAEGNVNLLAIMRKGDARFDNSVREQLHFQTSTANFLVDVLGIPQSALDGLDVGDTLETDIENPTCAGQVLRIQRTDSTSGDKYQSENVLTKCKQIKIADEKTAARYGMNIGDVVFFVEEATGKPIFTNTEIVLESNVRAYSPIVHKAVSSKELFSVKKTPTIASVV